jgi:hypothetical protein
MIQAYPHAMFCEGDWIVRAGLDTSRMCLLIGAIDTSTLMHNRSLEHLGRNLSDVCRTKYAFEYRQRWMMNYENYHYGMIPVHIDHHLTRDGGMNFCWWSSTDEYRDKQFSAGLLRDIYPTSYLSRPYLDARLGHSRTTLEQWIKADPGSRGTLEPFTDILTKWTPPVEKIPQIREELYRAGRVFYWRFFSPKHGGWMGIPETIEPLYRPDLSAPWEAPEPIPEIYRADFWKDKDPSLTY